MATPPPVATESRILEAEVISYGTCISCPSCQNRIINDGSHAGQTVCCPHCGASVQMPGGGTQIVPPPITVVPNMPTAVVAGATSQPSGPYDFLNELDCRPCPKIGIKRRRRMQFRSLVVTLTTAIGSLLVLALLCIYWLPYSNAPAKTPVDTTAAIPETLVPPSVTRTLMTKDEWKVKAWEIRCKTGKATQSEIRHLFGKPFRTQTIANKQFWYWHCQDGIIQAEVVAYGDEVYIIGVNDY
jgi:ribosomal protein S27E